VLVDMPVLTPFVDASPIDRVRMKAGEEWGTRAFEVTEPSGFKITFMSHQA
jgi:hypothetical protein